jgi:hypothetical protein
LIDSKQWGHFFRPAFWLAEDLLTKNKTRKTISTRTAAAKRIRTISVVPKFIEAPNISSKRNLLQIYSGFSDRSKDQRDAGTPEITVKKGHSGNPMVSSSNRNIN